MRHLRINSRTARKRRVPLSLRQQQARVRGLAAINRIRRGESKTLSAAARVEGTTVRSIRQNLPAALFQNRPRGRIRVKAGDPYSARVEIITDRGPLEVNARGSRERELAGRHRAAVMRVLRGDEPASSLKQFRGRKVGGHKLTSNFDRVLALAQADLPDQLDSLYVSPETRA